jgi:hypothetical protein
MLGMCIRGQRKASNNALAEHTQRVLSSRDSLPPGGNLPCPGRPGEEGVVWQWCSSAKVMLKLMSTPHLREGVHHSRIPGTPPAPVGIPLKTEAPSDSADPGILRSHPPSCQAASPSNCARTNSRLLPRFDDFSPFPRTVHGDIVGAARASIPAFVVPYLFTSTPPLHSFSGHSFSRYEK